MLQLARSQFEHSMTRGAGAQQHLGYVHAFQVLEWMPQQGLLGGHSHAPPMRRHPQPRQDAALGAQG